MNRVKFFLVCLLVEVAGKILEPILRPPEQIEDDLENREEVW